MSESCFSRLAFGLFTATLFLTGCGGTSNVPPKAALQPPMAESPLNRSWTKSSAKSGDLLYVSNLNGYSGYGEILVFSYPGKQLVGELSEGIFDPQGLCVDEARDVWIVNFGSSQIVEYAHGGTSPIATLSDPNTGAFACSVDRISGDLAVSDLGGHVAIYPSAQGSPTIYSDPSIRDFYYCAYDNEGNLFVDGSSGNLIAELPKGASTFNDITLSKSVGPGSLQWKKTYLAAASLPKPSDGTHGSIAIYQIKVSSSTGTIVGKTLLKTERNRRTIQRVQYWIEGNTIIGPNFFHGGANSYLNFWKYPSGGKPTAALLEKTWDLWAAVVSRGTSNQLPIP